MEEASNLNEQLSAGEALYAPSLIPISSVCVSYALGSLYPLDHERCVAAAPHCACFTKELAMTNYNAPAELYPGRNHKTRSVSRYQRFPSLAEAVRYTIEELPLSVQPGSMLEAEEVRYDGGAIRELYFSEDYPLQRAFMGHVVGGRTS